MSCLARAWLTGEEPLQTVINVVPSVIGMSGNGRGQQKSQHRCTGYVPRIRSHKTHYNNPSSVFSPTLSKRIGVVAQKEGVLLQRQIVFIPAPQSCPKGLSVDQISRGVSMVRRDDRTVPEPAPSPFGSSILEIGYDSVPPGS
jgi:hypothetical protein